MSRAMCSSQWTDSAMSRDAVCVYDIGPGVGFAPLIGKAMSTWEEHSEAVAHLPIDHICNGERAFDKGREGVAGVDVFPITGITAASGFGLVGVIQAVYVFGGVDGPFVMGVFLAVAPFLLPATAELFFVRHDDQVTMLVPELLPYNLDEGSAAGE